mgnify:CR=1 FL=1
MSEFDNNAKINCPFCGESNESGVKFCTNCGTKLEMKEAGADSRAAEPISSPQEEIAINYERTAPVYSEPALSSQSSDAVVGNHTTPVYSSTENTGAGSNAKGLAIASMVCGILSLLCCCIWYIGGILAIVGLVLGIISIRKGTEGRGMAMAGIITSVLGLVIGISLMLFGVFIAMTDPDWYNELLYELYNFY